MSNAGQNGPSSPTPPPSGDWREMRRAERRARRGDLSEMWPGVPLAGVVLIGVGVLFLLTNFGLDLPQRWWAIFIMLPAAAALVTAARFYAIDGKLSSRAAGSATGGLLLLAVGVILYFDLNWSLFWPVLLIIVGVGIVARGYRRPDDSA